MSYIMLNINLGLFIVFLVITISLADFSPLTSRWIETDIPSRIIGFFIAIGKQTLVIYLLETPVRELLAFLLSLIFPTWNASIPACFIFGAGLVFLWVIVISLLNRKNIIIANQWWNDHLFSKRKG